MHRAAILAFALLAALAVDANPIATKLLTHARKGAASFKTLARNTMKAHGMKAKSESDDVCQAYIQNIFATCSEWHDQLESDNVNFEDFCGNPCWTSISMANNTACLMTEPEAAASISLIDVACSRRGPNNGYCGTVVQHIMSGSECERIESQNTCENNELPVTCAWNNGGSNSGSGNGGRCELAIVTPNLAEICSPCISDLFKAVAKITNSSQGGNIDIDSSTLTMFQNLLCVQVDGVFCAVSVKTTVDAITETEGGDSLTTTQLGSICANRTQTTCLRRMIPSVASIMRDEALKQAMYCAARYGNLDGSEFRSTVRDNCLNCYLGQVLDARRTLAFVDNLCDKSESGTYCLSLLNFQPSTELQVCYQNVVAAATCSNSCNSIFGGFLSTYGCCFGLLALTMNKTNLVDDSDYAMFYAAAQKGKSLGWYNNNNGPNEAGHAMAAQDSAAPDSMAPFGSGSSSCGDPLEGDGADLSKLAVCPATADVVVRMRTFCAYTRAPQKIARAIHLKLNCSAVLADEAVKNSIVDAIVRDIAQNIGLPIDAITGVVFICPTEAPTAREHHFAILAAGPATLQFVIQSDNSAATDAAAAQLDAALSEGTMSFPALTSTVSTSCTTCASEADLANLATAADLVPTPAPDTTSSASALHTLLAAAALLIVALVA